MRKLLGLICLALGGTSAFLAAGGLAQTSGSPQSIHQITIRGTINPGSSSFLQSAIREAERAQAQALLVELDTPGGLVSSVQDMAQAIDRSSVPVIVYVTPAGAAATSAGALLSLASHVAAMSPGAHIGAAHPVDSSGKEVEGAMGKKILNDTAAFARGLAELRGRNRELAEKVVTQSTSLTAKEAFDQRLIEILAPTRAELLKMLDGRKVHVSKDRAVVLRTTDAPVVEHEMTWGQKLLHLLANPNIATILMTLGILLIYVEVSNPGITIAGALGVIFLLVAFMSFQMLPIRATGLALMVLGLAMLVAEAFVSAHGALAIGGTLGFILGVLWVMDPSGGRLAISPKVWVPAAVTLLSSAFLLTYAALRTKDLVKTAQATIKGGGQSGLLGYTGHVERLDPGNRTGQALIRGEIWAFESDEELKPGDTVQVVKVQGMKATVRRG